MCYVNRDKLLYSSLISDTKYQEYLHGIIDKKNEGLIYIVATFMFATNCTEKEECNAVM